MKTIDNTQKIERIDISTSVKEVKPEMVCQEVNVAPEYAEIGLQYS